MDRALQQLLASLGTSPDRLLGRGGEASVYALGSDRVLRLCHPGTTEAQARARASLLSEVGRGSDRVGFAVPEVLDIVTVGRRVGTLERRLPGRPMDRVLGMLLGSAREDLVRDSLEVSSRIGELPVERPFYGDLMAGDALRADCFRDYLQARAAQNLTLAGPPFDSIDPGPIASALPEPVRPGLVHLDVFAGNLLVEGSKVTAVLDFGTVSIVGDRRLDPLASAAYLSPHITPQASDRDRAVARAWLSESGLEALYVPARRWLAAFWSRATDDLALQRFCHAVLCADSR